MNTPLLPDEPTNQSSEAGKALGALGASKGGRARREALSADERKKIAREAVRARWAKAGKLKQPEDGGQEPPTADIVVAAKGPNDLPFSMFRGTLAIGGVEMECHVLNDFRRVFTQREIVKAISGGRTSGDLKVYLARNPLIDQDFFAAATIRFKIPGNPNPAIGYEATLLIEICDKYIEASERKPPVLQHTQLHLVVQAAIIVRASAKTGIVALVDEATGFQQYRAKHALQIKFQAFIADELQDWARMFPTEFWVELARLEGIHYSPRHRPLRWGRYVMMFVYDAIDPDIGRELRKKNPNPHFQQNHHQWLKKWGRERVNDQIQRNIAIMKLCENMNEFREKFARVFKKAPLQFTFDDVGWGSPEKSK